jgi:hypothetical protein
VQLQLDRRCWELSWLAWHKGHVGLCCIPLAAKLPAVRIFSCRAVHPKKTTFGSALYQLPQIYKFMQLLACRDATQCINPVVVQELLCYCSFLGVLINLYRLWSDFFFGACPYRHLSCQNSAFSRLPSFIFVDDWNIAGSLSSHRRIIPCHGLLSFVHGYQNHLLRRAPPNRRKSIIPRPHHDDRFSSAQRSNFLLISRCRRVGSCRSSCRRPHHHDEMSRHSCLAPPQPIGLLSHSPTRASNLSRTPSTKPWIRSSTSAFSFI